MKNCKTIVLGLCVLGLSLALGWYGRGLAAPESALPGSENDPLVTKSYVDAQIASSMPQSDLVVVDVPAGKSLIGFAGAEIILRGGTAKAVDSQSGGLCDVTSGTDLRSGQNIPANHLLIIPRDDGRGILAVNDVIVMVRGRYTVQ